MRGVTQGRAVAAVEKLGMERNLKEIYTTRGEKHGWETWPKTWKYSFFFQEIILENKLAQRGMKCKVSFHSLI